MAKYKIGDKIRFVDDYNSNHYGEATNIYKRDGILVVRDCFHCDNNQCPPHNCSKIVYRFVGDRQTDGGWCYIEEHTELANHMFRKPIIFTEFRKKNINK